MPFLTVEATGHIKPVASNTAPPGYLACDGSTVAIASYPSLYALLGTSYNTGGEPAGSFRLPDLRGKLRLGQGQDAGRGLSMRSVGQYVGQETHSLSASEMPPHTHSGTTDLSADTHTHTGSSTGSVNLAHTHWYYGTGVRTDGENCSSRPAGESITSPDSTGVVNSSGTDITFLHNHSVSVTALSGTHSHNTYSTDNAGLPSVGAAHNNVGVCAPVYYYIKY